MEIADALANYREGKQRSPGDRIVSINQHVWAMYSDEALNVSGKPGDTLNVLRGGFLYFCRKNISGEIKNPWSMYINPTLQRLLD